MKILVLNGSPKGELSVTLQYIRYLEKVFSEHEFEIVPVAQKIRILERLAEQFDELMASVRRADLIVWATPVYYFLVPAQLKRFIELIFERETAEAFSAKQAAAITTSIHFFDHTAHNYLTGISEDLGMVYRGGHSAGMNDLKKEWGQRQIEHFAARVFDAAAAGKAASVSTIRIDSDRIDYRPGPGPASVSQGERRVLVLSDQGEGSENLNRMIKRVVNSFAEPVEVVNLADLDLRGYCQGCLQCGFDNQCLYEGRDGFTDFFKNTVMKADILFFAGSIRDRYLSARWKMFFDRSFFRGHVPSLTGKQLAWVISGPLRQLPNLRQVLEAYTEFQDASLTGMVSDEYSSSETIDELLDALISRSLEDDRAGTRLPVSFFGVGGKKLLRDAVYGELRFIFQADHRSYQRYSRYDFPQRRIGLRLLNSAAPLLRLPSIRRRFVPRIRDGMVRPLKKVVDRIDEKGL